MKLSLHLFLYVAILGIGVVDLSYSQDPPYKAKIRLGKLLWDEFSFDGSNYNQNEWEINLYVDVFDSNDRQVTFNGPSAWWKQVHPDSSYFVTYRESNTVSWDGQKIQTTSIPVFAANVLLKQIMPLPLWSLTATRLLVTLSAFRMEAWV